MKIRKLKLTINIEKRSGHQVDCTFNYLPFQKYFSEHFKNVRFIRKLSLLNTSIDILVRVADDMEPVVASCMYAGFLKFVLKKIITN